MIRRSLIRALVVTFGASVVFALQLVANAASVRAKTNTAVVAVSPVAALSATVIQPVADSGFPYPVSTQGMKAMTQADDRLRTLMSYTRRYRVSSTIAGAIYDNAIAYKIPIELAFRLVRVESVFDPEAVSASNAIGLTQLLVSTARNYDPTITQQDLFDPNTNLRIGFHYLRDLIRHFHGDISLALEAYNRGEDKIDAVTLRGDDARGVYSRTVLAAALK